MAGLPASTEYTLVFPFSGEPADKVPTKNGDPASKDGRILFSRIDSGVDMYSSGPEQIFAAADGTVTVTLDTSSDGGFGRYPVLIFDKPVQLPGGLPKATGIYYGHTTSIIQKDGSGNYPDTHYKANEHIANTTSPSGGNATTPYWLEMGWWGGSATGGPLQHGTQGEAATASGGEMSRALFGGQPVAGNSTVQAKAKAGGDGTVTGGDASGQGSGTGVSQTDIAAAQKYAKDTQPALTDPRDNRPFSPLFLGQVMGPWPGQSGSPTDPSAFGSAGYTPHGEGGLRFALFNNPGQQYVGMPYVNMVRGGMAEIPPRTGGRFAVYFMMNPESIGYSINIDPSKAIPDTLTPNNQQGASYLTTSQSVTFTLWFNRMYEVAAKDMPPGGGIGPSSEGVRWDIRAIERLVGLYDSTDTGTAGLSNNMPVSGAAAAVPIQIVFGGINSMQFQGRVQSLSYTYTRFDINMIPVEASVDIGVMRVYNPPLTADLVTSLITDAPMVYNATSSYTNWGALAAQTQANNSIGVINPVTRQP